MGASIFRGDGILRALDLWIPLWEEGFFRMFSPTCNWPLPSSPLGRSRMCIGTVFGTSSWQPKAAKRHGSLGTVMMYML